MIPRDECLKAIAKYRTNEIVITTMKTAREWPIVSKSDLDFNGLGTGMGHVPELGLGLALARPERKVLVLNGDGSMLMNLGTLVTIAHSNPKNYILIVFENGTYETTGGQPIPGLDKMNFALLAKASGIPKAYEYDALDAFEKDFPKLLKEDGPIFINLKVVPPRTEPPPARLVPIAEAAQTLRRMFTKN
ncbi:MAG: thiamine pyrophosphate-binding protein [Candidatus Tectomicrobia bacterium]|nr:thiamine pyrophosphate-binding protein [Candidatus Tectomicrobia bacterium]